MSARKELPLSNGMRLGKAGAQVGLEVSHGVRSTGPTSLALQAERGESRGVTSEPMRERRGHACQVDGHKHRARGWLCKHCRQRAFLRARCLRGIPAGCGAWAWTTERLRIQTRRRCLCRTSIDMCSALNITTTERLSVCKVGFAVCCTHGNAWSTFASRRRCRPAACSSLMLSPLQIHASTATTATNATPHTRQTNQATCLRPPAAPPPTHTTHPAPDPPPACASLRRRA